MLGICHSFGLLARWGGVARAVLRGPERGGKSAGIVTNVLTDDAWAHPFFGDYFAENGGPEVKVLDSRLFDLLPTGSGAARPLGFDCDGTGDGARRGRDDVRVRAHFRAAPFRASGA